MNSEKDNQRAPWWQPGLVLFTKLSGWIAGPVIAGVFLGKWLDKKYHSEPWLFLISVAIAFFFSMFKLAHDSIKEMNKIEKETERENGHADKNGGNNPM